MTLQFSTRIFCKIWRKIAEISFSSREANFMAGRGGPYPLKIVGPLIYISLLCNVHTRHKKLTFRSPISKSYYILVIPYQSKTNFFTQNEKQINYFEYNISVFFFKIYLNSRWQIRIQDQIIYFCISRFNLYIFFFY